MCLLIKKSFLIFLATLSPENNEGYLLHVLHGVYVCCKTRDIACISELTHFKCVIGTVEHILYCLRLFNDTVRDPNMVLPTLPLRKTWNKYCMLF